MADTVPFIVAIRSKGAGSIAAEAEVQIERLKENLKRAVGSLGAAFQDIGRVGLFELTEVTLGLEVGAEGGVHFIGTASVQATASVTLKFSPPPKSETPNGQK